MGPILVWFFSLVFFYYGIGREIERDTLYLNHHLGELKHTSLQRFTVLIERWYFFNIFFNWCTPWLGPLFGKIALCSKSGIESCKWPNPLSQSKKNFNKATIPTGTRTVGASSGLVLPMGPVVAVGCFFISWEIELAGLFRCCAQKASIIIKSITENLTPSVIIDSLKLRL